MGKITKTLQPKHKETLSPWLKNYVETTATTPLPQLPKQLGSFPSSWPFGRGDLYHWIPLLNRFDSIIEYFCSAYQLNKGPQDRDFGCDVLLNHSTESPFKNEQRWSMNDLKTLGFPLDGDQTLIEAVLKFTCMLLEHCGNRSIYASSSHLNDLLNTTSLTVLIATLEVGGELAQRYQASVKRIGTASRQLSSALLANHYNIDLDRVQQMALAFTKTPLISLSDPVHSHTPESSSKGKDKAQGVHSKSITSMHANDLVALATSDHKRWSGWGDVKVSYYPQHTVQEQHVQPEQGRSSMPSTPTPLRRSSTMTSQHQTPRSRNHFTDDSSPLGPRTPGAVDEQPTPGQKTFELPSHVVLSTPTATLVSKCPDDMPQASKYEVFHRIRVAKALLGHRKSRQQLLAVRLLAITNLAFIHTESNFVEKVLRQDVDETRRFQLVYQLAELIHPHEQIPLWLQAMSFTLLEAISHFPARVQDVLSAVNANVNHGILLYVIRKAVAGMKEEDPAHDDNQETEADEWRNNLFSLTLHLSMSTRVGSEMVSAGLMDILVEILNIRSGVAQRIHSMVLAFLDGLIWSYQVAFSSFFSAKGLDAVAQLVVDTVAKAQSLVESGHGVAPDQKSSIVDYEIPYFQQQTLRWLLKFAHHIMSNSYSYGGNTDRLLRNLVDKSDLLASLREIVEDKKSFGSLVWTNTATILSDFINNDPTSFAAISESGIIRTYLETITGGALPANLFEEQKSEEREDGDESTSAVASIPTLSTDMRPHPPSEETLSQRSTETLAQGILPSSDAISVVPQVLNSISLNNAGMKMVVASRAFDSYFEIFESPAHVKCMEFDGDLASNVGASFDELARHHPPLRASISNAVIDMIARLRYLGVQKAKTAAWGTKLLLVNSEGRTVYINENGETMPAKRSDGRSEVSSTGDMDVDMPDAVPENDTGSDARGDTWEEASNGNFTAYVYALANFLNSYIANAVLKNILVEQGGLELLFDICSSPSLPPIFADSVASRVLNQVVCQLVDTSPVRGLPSLMRRAQSAIDDLRPLALKTEPVPPYFAPFLTPDLSLVQDKPEYQEACQQGTKMVKALLNAQTFIKIISDCFPPSRSNFLQFFNVNVYDYYTDLIKSIGPLLRGVLAEEAGHLAVIPAHWAFRRPGSLPDGPLGASHAGLTAEETTSLETLDSTETTKAGESSSKDKTGPTRPTEQEMASPRFKNNETLRLLLHPLTPTTFPLFQTLGRVLLPRRERDPRDHYPRPRHLEIAQALADTILDQLRPSVATSGPSSRDFHFWIIMLHTITEMLVDSPTARTSERSPVQIIIPVLLAFKEQGGVDVLNNMLRVFSNAVREGAEKPSEESSKAKVAAFGLKKIMDLYLTLVNGRYITESCGNFGLLPRSTDRSQNSHVASQIVLELRAAIFPEIITLWESSFMEKVPHQTMARLLDILKLLSTGDHEPPSSLKEKASFKLLKSNEARFDWHLHRSVVDDLLTQGYEKDLALEGVFRANGHATNARDYCSAHKKGLAGARNPVPAIESDSSVLNDVGSQTQEGGPSNGASTSETDRMSLDGPPELETPDLSERFLGDALGDMMDRSSGETPRPANESQASDLDVLSTNAVEGSETTSGETQVPSSKENMARYRATLKENLIDRCLDVIRAHPSSAIEISELIRVMVLDKQNDDAQEEVGSTLTLALSSLAGDDDERKKNGKCIAAYAHLLALLLQDDHFFKNNIDNLSDKVDEYVSFLKTTPAPSTDEIPPWIPYILLVVEVLLSHDERPVAAQWTAPTSLDEEVVPPTMEFPKPLVDHSCRLQILESLLEMLPRIGKEETLAISALRVLVILTRNRSLAKAVGDKKNLQRLFLMTKQLAGSGSERLKQTKLTTHIMTILRHIVEDEEILKEIMRAEIKSTMSGLARSHRGTVDISTYLRAMSPVALRCPSLFIDVTNETVRYQRWTPPSDGSRALSLVLKEQAGEQADDKGDLEKQLGQNAAEQGIKKSTELADKEMSDLPKSYHETKRPVVENPDGVIHFLLCELVNYREVDDQEPSTGKEKTSDTEPQTGTQSESPSKEPDSADSKDKKPPKQAFKAEEHPIFVYRCFLLNCLTELLQSYNRTKMEFINFKRNAPPLTTHTPVKPRSSILNYLIYDLLCQGNLSGTTDTIAAKKKAATSAQTERLLVALVAKTPEKAVDKSKDKFAYEDEPDLLFVRRFVLDTMLKAYERAPNTDESLEIKYSRMQCLAELMNCMVSERDKDQNPSSRSDTMLTRSQAQLRRLMYEKGYLDKLTASIAEINLNYPGVKRAIKYILRVLRVLTETAKELSRCNILPTDSIAELTDDEIASSSSLSDLDDDREETPDLYRNSALGMLEPRAEDDESDEEDEDDDEDMYGDEYDDDEMDYDDDDMSDGQDNVSDEDEELSEMGEIEGLHGDPGVVEVIMDEDDDDEDDSEDDEDDDEVDSEDMEDVEDQVEIVDQDGNPIEDDGNSGWESDSHEDDDEDVDEELEFDAQVQDEEEAHMHGMGPSDLLDGMARAIMGDDGYDNEIMDGLDDHYLDDGHDDEEDDEDEDEMEDEEFIFDDEFPLTEQPQLPGLGWDGLNPETDDPRLVMMDNPGRRRLLTRMEHRPPFPSGFMVGSSHRDTLGDFRSYFSRAHRTGGPQPNSDDGANPLLRRRDAGRENPSRGGLGHSSVGLRLPEHIFGPGSRHIIDGPMGFLGELMEFLPIIGRNGQHSFHLQISGPNGIRETRDLGPFRARGEHRRDGPTQEPQQAVAFIVESTLNRYQEEARMLFGPNHSSESNKLMTVIAAKLTPSAMELERKVKTEEAELAKRLEEETKKMKEEQRLAKEAAEAKEKAEKEQKEAEEREARERAAAENAANTPTAHTDDTAMEGVETAEPDGQSVQEDEVAAPSTSEPRVMTTLRGEQIDVTDLGIDPDYLSALPEEFREEVIAQTISERRSQAREEAANTGESTEVFQEFLNVLPEELRLEIAQQERQEQRRRARESHSRPAAAAGEQTNPVPDMDAATILLTFPPELRQQVLMEQGEELLDQLPPEMAAQARALSRSHRPPIAGRHSSGHSRPAPPGPPGQQGDQKPQRRAVVQMLDKAGVATLLRLMFIAQQGSIRNYLFSVFADVCENRQNRLEVISTLLQILQDGSTDMAAVELSFGLLSLKARRTKDKDKDFEQRTPQQLRRSLTVSGNNNLAQTNSETSPLLIVQQCLDLLVDLSTKNLHIPWLFLTEHEIVGSTLKRSFSRKSKVRDPKAQKYAINSLLSLLDRDLVMESSVVMAHLADLLNRVTLPLLNLERRRKEAEEELQAANEKLEKAKSAEGASSGPTTTEESGGAPVEGESREEKNDDILTPEQIKEQEKKRDAAQKKLRQLQPPVIPTQNLTLAVRIFVAQECSSKTFQNTISTIKNLSAIPEAKSTFGLELVHQARLLSENIVSDLDDLLPHIEQAASGTEIQGLALAKFSPGASEQNKLLRVLTALDHLFDSKKKNEDSEQGRRRDERQDLVTSLYHNSTFSAMWEKLSACLRAIRQRENMLNVATILLPLIESLMVVCKNTTMSDDPTQNKEMVLSSPPPESRTASLFFTFTEEHRRILNELVRNNPKLMSGTFALLVKNPKVLEFDNKRNYFNRSVHSRNNQARAAHGSLQLSVRREQVFHDSFKSLYFKTGDEMKYGKLNIRFHGEEGVDAGGVTREWFQVLSRQMFDPNYVLFTPVSSDRTTFHPNKLSGINEEHLLFFKFIGRIIGKALYEGRVLDCYFSRAVYKRILGKSVSVKDMESFDPDYYKSLCWMLENDITDIITETFSVEDDEFGVSNVIDLIPNGREVTVTEENKHEYVRLVVEHKLLSSVKEQMENFLYGFHEIIPAELIAIFNEQELELLISGLPDIDVDDWKSNTEYHNYTPSSQQIQWFWRAVRSFDKEERAKLLQFVTGTSKVPLQGFKELEGMNGVNRFNIHRDYGNKDRLPSSHTCFNQLDLPEYESYDILRSQIMKAITAGSEYFGFA